MPDPAPIPTDTLALLIEAINAAGASEALDAAAAARFWGVGRSMFYKLDRDGLCPEPVTIGDDGPRRWLKTELRAFLLSQCKSRRDWKLIREQALKRYG